MSLKGRRSRHSQRLLVAAVREVVVACDDLADAVRGMKRRGREDSDMRLENVCVHMRRLAERGPSDAVLDTGEQETLPGMYPVVKVEA